MDARNRQLPLRISLAATLVLIISVLHGTSSSLTLAYHFRSMAGVLEPVVNLSWGFAYLISFLGLISGFGVNWISWMVRYRFLLTVVVSGAVFSTFWSIDPNLTIERGVHLVGTTLIALYIGFRLPLTRILTTGAMVLWALLIASTVAALFFQDLGIEQYEGRAVWRGVMTSKNTLGFWSAISLLLFVSLSSWPQSLASRFMWLLAIATAVLTLTMSYSATSALAMALAIICAGYLGIARRFQFGLIAMLMLAVLAGAMAGLAIWQINTAEVIGRTGDLTGRGEVWRQTWNLIVQQPLTGYGYGTLWNPTEASLWIQQSLTDFSWVVFHAHNGLLQIASELGLPLTILCLLMVLQQLIEVIYCQYQRQQLGALFVLAFLVALLVSNFSEARLLVNRELFWIWFVALPISMLQQIDVVLADQPTDARFNPVPAGLAPRMVNKTQTLASRRSERQELKQRLRQRREGGADEDNESNPESHPDDDIIDMTPDNQSRDPAS